MKVKVDGVWHSGTIEPVAIELSDRDRMNINNMCEGCTKYCQYPQGLTEEEIRKFMAEDGGEA